MAKYKKVTVTWLDSHNPSAIWVDLDSQDGKAMLKEPLPEIETTGRLVFKNKSHIVIAQSINAEQMADGFIKIPRFAIAKGL